MKKEDFYDLLELRKNFPEDEGIREKLQSYKVDNAIIMAAGMSSRFVPLSLEKPKGLLEVRGEILIERQIRQLQAAGIDDITVVVGYKKEMFFYLEEQFHVKLVVNPDYYKYNNTSTLMCVLPRLKNTYICSSDNYFVDNVFEEYVYRGYYAAVFAEGPTDEYCLEYAQDGRITNVAVGGRDAWYMLGHAYFDRAFSDKFRQILAYDYEHVSDVRNKLWEDVYIAHLDELSLCIRKYDYDRVKEFDSLDELRNFDENYLDNLNSSIMDNIAGVLDCRKSEIKEIYPIKAGMTNISFCFSCRGKRYVYRHPGEGTEKYISRANEAFAMEQASRLELDNTFIYMDARRGWKISHYIDNVRMLDYHNADDVHKALKLVRRLHEAKIKSDCDGDIWSAVNGFIDKLQHTGNIKGFHELYDFIKRVYDYAQLDNVEKVLCHNDCYDPNFLLDEQGSMYLIDWEYSCVDDPATDLGTFICCSDYSYSEALDIIKIYLGYEPGQEELRHYIAYIAVASYYWYLWALYQEANNNHVGDYLYIWYKYSREYGRIAADMYEGVSV